MSVNVFDTSFTSLTGDGTAILRGHPSHASRSQCEGSVFILSYFKALSIGPAPAIKPMTSRSAVKGSTDRVNPATVEVKKIYSQGYSTADLKCLS